jgi:hypothetical protein
MATTQIEKATELPALVPSAASPSPPARAFSAVLSAHSTRSWFVAVSLLVVASGGYRFWRDHQFQVLADGSAACPFPLEELPKELQSWRAVEGIDAQLDPETARVAGSSDHIVRVYENTSGDRVSVLVLYGLARTVFAHTHEFCYPSSGYRTVGERTDRKLDLPGLDGPAEYRSAFFSKSDGGFTRYEEVFCSFRYNGSWVPDPASRWKLFRYVPGMFKVQTQRHTDALSADNSPSESLLRELVSAIEARIPAASHRRAK